jgi:hypothetical protein
MICPSNQYSEKISCKPRSSWLCRINFRRHPSRLSASTRRGCRCDGGLRGFRCLVNVPANAEHAATSPGAHPATVLHEVTLPLVRAGVGADMIFAFISSFDDVNLSIFVSSPQQRPLTVQIIQVLEFGFSPTLAAISILSMLLPLALVAIFGRFVRINDFLQQERGHG